MTPTVLAAQIVQNLDLTPTSRVLEPSFGDGAFLLPLIEQFWKLRSEPTETRLGAILRENVFGVELDADLYATTLKRIESAYGPLPALCGLQNADFFKTEFFEEFFDYVVGNPPFGGTFDPTIEDNMERRYGRWAGRKLKKETYSFFIARSVDLLAPGGSLVFICSDTFLTINTMAGLRLKLLDLTTPVIERLPAFSDEVAQETLVLHAKKGGDANAVIIDGTELPRSVIETTGNLSWGIDHQTSRYFSGPTLADVVVASSGMTIGANDLFLREVLNDRVLEPFLFEFFDDPITLERELSRARLHKMSPAKRERVLQQEKAGATVRNVRVVENPNGASEVQLPHPDYRFYNKATNEIVYSPPRCAIFWRDEGDAVYTFKKNGRWYLEGVGGKPYFGREGLSWGLIASRINMRYLPPGYILDSGGPCAFLREGVPREELWFILGWCLTDLATRILKSVINHTRNIQSKDIERLPYPFWVDQTSKEEVVALVEGMVNQAQEGKMFSRDDPAIEKLESIFAW